MRDIVPATSGLILTPDIHATADRAAFFAAVRSGEYVRVTRGAYLAAERWSLLSIDERYRMLLHAVAGLATEAPLFSHDSAAALWRLPWIGAREQRAHVLVPAADGGRSSSSTRRHAERAGDVGVEVDGLRATTLARTVVDLARTLPFGPAVAIADAALRRATHPHPSAPAGTVRREELIGALELVPRRLGAARAERVVAFADAAADRPGESLSRANMLLAGLPMPLLQVPIRGASGRRWFVDFYWPSCRLIGEFDGRAKYRDPEFLRGRRAEDVVYQEKLREDDLRSTGRRFTRWPWQVAVSPSALRDHLLAAGLR